MAYDTGLEHRIAAILPEYGDFSKKKMFGGIVWLLKGNICVGIHT